MQYPFSAHWKQLFDIKDNQTMQGSHKPLNDMADKKSNHAHIEDKNPVLRSDQP
jgi:hypothetical protein